jgi:hypothetical protein
MRDPVVRTLCHRIEYQFEPFGVGKDGPRYSKGIIDLTNSSILTGKRTFHTNASG